MTRRRPGMRWAAGAALSLAVTIWGSLALLAGGERAVAALVEDPAITPVEIMAAPHVLRAGDPVDVGAVERSLAALGYRKVSGDVENAGQYRRTSRELAIYRRPHLGALGPVESAMVRVGVSRGRITRLRDRDGRSVSAFTCEPELLGSIRGPQLVDRRPLPLGQFPVELVQAVIAAEDARFREHSGLDLRAVARALWADLRRRGPLQGGSTITQQVIKNRIVGRQRTLFRKAREAALALYVEGRVTKERILEIYLNEIYMGQRGPVSVIGMPAAALHYFGKDVRHLDLPEAALLAGIIASPGRFDPRRRADAVRDRREWVLSRMVETGAIDGAAHAAATAAPIETTPAQDSEQAAGDLIDAVQRESEQRGWTPRPGPKSARIFTSIDAAVQQAAEESLRATLDALERQRPSRAPLEGAVVVMRPGSGELIALVGSRQGLRGGFHRALEARRQPGSAFKPFVALAAFNAGGWSPSRIVEDEPLEVDTPQGPWRPRNIDGEYRGPVSVREALEKSLNVPFARIGLEIGPDAVVRTTRAAGVTRLMPRIPAIALGVGEMTPLELATGYATIAALGVVREPFMIRATRLDGERAPMPLAGRPPPERALAEADCFMVLDMMAGVVERGTAAALRPALDGLRVAAKTGTTQDGRDAWFVMISGEAVVVVWIGRDDGRPARLSGSGAALPVVTRLLDAVGTRLLAPLPFPPPGVVLARIDPLSGGIASYRCPYAVDELFRRDELPEACELHGGLWRRFWRRSREAPHDDAR